MDSLAVVDRTVAIAAAAAVSGLGLAFAAGYYTANAKPESATWKNVEATTASTFTATTSSGSNTTTIATDKLLSERLAVAEAKLIKQERKTEQERKGRTLAERALRRRIQGWCDTHGNLFHAIGWAETPFPDRRGTPRQGRLAPATRGVIRLHAKLSEGLDGLEAYSHLWVFFVFNENTSTTKRVLGPKAGQKGGSLAALVRTVDEEEENEASASASASATATATATTIAATAAVVEGIEGEQVASSQEKGEKSLVIGQGEEGSGSGGDSGVGGREKSGKKNIAENKQKRQAGDEKRQHHHRQRRRVSGAATTEQYWSNAKAFTKVAPPSMQGGRTGVFATRSPHHPNPIGLTLVRIVKVDRECGAICVSGIDLLNGTPVLDVKPYVPAFDIMKDATAPAWQVDSLNNVLPVTFEENAEAQLAAALASGAARLHHGDISETRKALEQVLRLDIRSVWTGRGSNWHDAATATGQPVRASGVLAEGTTEMGMSEPPAPGRGANGGASPEVAAASTWEVYYCDLRLCFVTGAEGVHVLSVEVVDATARDGLSMPLVARSKNSK